MKELFQQLLREIEFPALMSLEIQLNNKCMKDQVDKAAQYSQKILVRGRCRRVRGRAAYYIGVRGCCRSLAPHRAGCC